MASPSGFYNVTRQNVSTTTAITVIQVATPATALIEVVRAAGSQSSSTTSAATLMVLQRTSTASTVTSATPSPRTPGMQASKCVGGVSATGVTASAEGTLAQTYWQEGFNLVSNGSLYLPVPEERPLVGISSFIGLKHIVAPTGNWSHQIDFLEYAF